MTGAVALGTGAAPAAVLKRHVAAAVAGNALEFYDFTTYAFFAVQVGHAFFPNKSEFISLILSLGTFGVGFLLRPVGAVVIGRYADRVGRRPAMLFSLSLMGVSVLGLALTPTFAQIGLAAPIIVLAWRLIQGFALGGEVGPTTSYLVEAAPPQRRALYSAWQGASQSLAAIAGGGVGFAVANLAGQAGLEAWGWRLAFGLGALILPVGYWLRRTLPETLHRPDEGPKAHPPQADVRGHMGIFLIGLGLISAGTVGTYVNSFMTTYAITTLHVPARISLSLPIVTGLVAVVSCLAGGVLSDRWGRKPFLVGARAGLLILALPVFWLIVRNHDTWTLLAGAALLNAISNFGAGALYAGLIESMHRELRGAGFGLVYSLAVSVVGGATQPFIAWLIHVSGNPLSPAWCMMAVNVVGLIAALAFRESAHVRLVSKEV